MVRSSFNPAAWSVGSKITAFTFALVGLILAALVFTISLTTSSLLESRAGASAASELRGVLNMVTMFDKAASSEAATLSHILAADYEGAFSVDADTVDIDGKPVPVLNNGGKPVNLDFTITDRFTAKTRAIGTVFVLSGDDFVRVSTSIKLPDGARAVGTTLDRTEPAYAKVRAGQAYSGPAAAFGKQFMTRYEPLMDGSGHLVGALSVGVDITADMAALKAKIREIKIGDTGYFFVLNAAPGKGLGDLLVHPVKEGANLLAAKDSNGREFIKEVLEKKAGVISYPWLNAEKGETTPRDKTVTYGSFPQWNWVIAGGTYNDEITREAASLRNRYIGFGLVALAVFAVLLFLMVRATVTRPLTLARDAAIQIARGDLSVQHGQPPAGRDRSAGRSDERHQQQPVVRRRPGARRRRADRHRLARDLDRQPRPVRRAPSSRHPTWPPPPPRWSS